MFEQWKFGSGKYANDLSGYEEPESLLEEDDEM